jgi:quercetin dioxygenase-like cupin family protein
MRNILDAAAVGTMLIGLSLTPGVAQATPGGPGVSGRILAQRTIGDRDYILREITIPPGQATGWHYHDGYLYAYVKQGTLSHFNAACASDGVYAAGSFLKETPGADHVHIGQNRGATDVVLEVLYVLPHGAPLAEDAPDPGCEPQ